MSQIVNDVQCPLLGREIELGYCMDIQDVVDNMIESGMLEDNIPPEKYHICQHCPKRIDPAA